MKKILLLGLLFWHVGGIAQSINLNLKDVPLVDAINLLARFLKRNIIINPTIEGVVNLQLQNAEAQQVLAMVLLMHGMASVKLGNIWYVDTTEALFKRKEEESKWLTLKKQHTTRVFKVWQIKYAKATELVNLLKDAHNSVLSNNSILQVDRRTNRIFIYGTQTTIHNINTLIKKLDVPIAQVLIEARVVSLDQDSEQALGINFVSKVAVTGEQHTADTKLDAGSFSLAMMRLADTSLLDIKLAALERSGKAELISTPSLFTGNLQTAIIEAGEEVPYQEVSESGGTAVVFKKAVLALKVTPQVLPGQCILLRLQINQDRPSNKMILGVPTISTRQITTHILAKTGQTIVLGGIFESNQETGYQGLPYLSHLPLLKFLFKQQNLRTNRRKLLIFVTPRLIYS